MDSLPQEKLDWLKEVGAKEFERPMKWYVGTNCVFSEEYLKETPLEVLKEKFGKRPAPCGSIKAD